MAKKTASNTPSTKTGKSKTVSAKLKAQNVQMSEAELKERSEAHPFSVPFLWLGRKSIQDNFIYIPLAGLIITIALGLVFPMHHKAPWDFFASWAIIGFVAYSFVVLSAEPLFKLLSRPEDYYGEVSSDD